MTIRWTEKKWIAVLLFIIGNILAVQATAATLQETLAGVRISMPNSIDVVHKRGADVKIDVNFSGVLLEKSLKKVAQKAGLKISYRQDIMVNKRISFHQQQVSLADVLNHLLKDTILDYKIMNNEYLVIYASKTPLQNVKAYTISGVVTSSETGQPLPGVNILIKGTSTGTATEGNGTYELMVSSLQDTLVFSFIGFKTQVIPINGRTEINVTMVPQTVSAEELVVVGYGTKRKISLIGAQASVAGEEVDRLNVSSASLTNSLAGRLPGVVGVQRSGKPGADASDIWIRGIATFGSSSPLVLVDGVERPMNSLNPDDIKSLTILKDASATAIYGTRGANGVILIETKTGHKGAPSIHVDYYEGITTFTMLPNMADGPTYMRLANEALTTRGGEPIYSEEEIRKTANGVNPLLYPNVDWLDTIFNDFGRNRQLNASIGGGSDFVRYYVSLTYYNEKGLLVDSDSTDYSTNTHYNKYQLRSNFTIDMTPSTQIQLGVGGYLEDRKYPSVGTDAIFSQALEASPVAYPVMYPGGRVPGRNPNGGERNPFVDATSRGYSDSFHSQLFTNLEITQELDMFVKGLSVRGLFGFDTRSTHSIERMKRPNTYYIDRSDLWDPDGTYHYNLTYEGQPALSFGSSSGGFRAYHIQGSINYEHDFSAKHHISSLLVYMQTDEQGTGATSFAESIPHREQSIAFRSTYSYDNRYFLEVNFGYSGSENFAPENRFGFFPSIGVGWVISNEEFFEPLTDVINFLKIRYSDGYVGATGSLERRFAYLTLVSKGVAGYTFGLNENQGRGGIGVTEYGVDVRWAEARMQNLGLEIRALQGKLSLVVNFYKERREGILLRRESVPGYLGLSNAPYANIGTIENIGFDGQLRFSSHIGSDFSFTIRSNFTYNQNTIIQDGRPPQRYPWMEHTGNNLLARYGYVALGLFESEEEIRNHATQFGQVRPGDIKYKDLNGDGEIDAYDRTKIGHGDVPYLTIGGGLALRYKMFDLQAFFVGQFGAEDLIGGRAIQPFQGGGGRGNLFAAAKDRWTVEDPDPNATFPRLAYGEAANENNTKVSSFWVRDLDFIRLKQLEIGYTLPVTWTANTAVKNFRIYLRGQNLFLFSSFDLWDPELNTANGSSYPLTTVYSIGFDIEF